MTSILSITRSRVSRLAGVWLLLCASSVATITATATPASAATCQKPSWTNNSSMTMKGTGPGVPSYYVRNGMNESCNITDQVGSSVVVNADCYRVNSSNNTWIHIDWNNRTVSGWVYGGNLQSLGGSLNLC